MSKRGVKGMNECNNTRKLNRDSLSVKMHQLNAHTMHSIKS